MRGWTWLVLAVFLAGPARAQQMIVSPAPAPSAGDGALLLTGVGLAPAALYHVFVGIDGGWREVGSMAADSTGTIMDYFVAYPCRPGAPAPIAVAAGLDDRHLLFSQTTAETACLPR